MPKIVLDDITTENNVVKTNENMGKIEQHLNDKVLYRETVPGTENHMRTNLDMNSHRIYNLPYPLTGTEPVRRMDLDNWDGGSGGGGGGGPTSADMVSFRPYGQVQNTNVQSAMENMIDLIAAGGGGGGGGGEIEYGGVGLANFSISPSTPNGRVPFVDTNPLGWNIGPGRCTVSFEWIANNYWTLNPVGHVAVVTRCDTSLLATAVRGTGIAFGHLNDHSLPNDNIKFMVNESWVNGIGPGGRSNWLLPRSESPAGVPLKDGVLYKTIIDSTMDHNNIRYLRHRVYERDEAKSMWVIVNDTGDMLDPNVQADLTKSGLAFGQVLSSAGSGWSIDFTNIKVVWGPPGAGVTDVSDKLSKRGAYLEGSLYVMGKNGTAVVAAEANDINFNIKPWGTSPVQPKLYFKSNGTNIASVQGSGFHVHGNIDISQGSSRIKIINDGGASAWTSFQNAVLNRGTNVLAIPSGTSNQSAFTAMDNSNADLGRGLSFGMNTSGAYVNAFNEAGGSAPSVTFALSNVSQMKYDLSGIHMDNHLWLNKVNTRIYVNSSGTPSAWTRFIDATGNADTKLVVTPNKTSGVGATILANTSDVGNTGYMSMGCYPGYASIHLGKEGSAAVPSELRFSWDGNQASSIRATSSGIYLPTALSPIGKNTGILQTVYGFGGSNATYFTNSTNLNFEDFCTPGSVTNYFIGKGFTNQQADTLEGIIRPMCSIISVAIASARNKGTM